MTQNPTTDADQVEDVDEMLQSPEEEPEQRQVLATPVLALTEQDFITPCEAGAVDDVPNIEDLTNPNLKPITYLKTPPRAPSKRTKNIRAIPLPNFQDTPNMMICRTPDKKSSMAKEDFLTPTRKRLEPFQEVPRGPRTPLQRGQVKVVVNEAGTPKANGSYKPKGRSLWMKRVLPTLPERQHVFPKNVPTHPLSPGKANSSMVVPPLTDTDGSFQIAFYNELKPGQCGWALSYVTGGAPLDPVAKKNGGEESKNEEWSIQSLTLPNVEPTQETHLYYCLVDEPPHSPNDIPLEGWMVSEGIPPAPTFNLISFSKNSEIVMRQAMKRLEVSSAKRSYTKTDLLAARCYYQDLPDIVREPNYPRNIIFTGAGSQSAFKLLDEERIARRQKQIDIGKKTAEYKAYVKAVPKDRRPPNAPQTPPLLPKRNGYDVSKRRFTGLVRAWRRTLHTFQIPTPEELDLLAPLAKEPAKEPQKPRVRRRRKPELYDSLGRLYPQKPLIRTPPRKRQSFSERRPLLIPMVSPKRRQGTMTV